MWAGCFLKCFSRIKKKSLTITNKQTITPLSPHTHTHKEKKGYNTDKHGKA